jgi:hypothetical protein
MALLSKWALFPAGHLDSPCLSPTQWNDMQANNPRRIPKQPISDKYFQTRLFGRVRESFSAANAASHPAICCQANNVASQNITQQTREHRQSFYFNELHANTNSPEVGMPPADGFSLPVTAAH